MIAAFSKNLAASGVHAKPFDMKRALSFFASIAVLLYLGRVLFEPVLASPSAQQIWVATWSSSQQIPEPRNELPLEDLRDTTVRQIFHLSLGGSALRVHMSNAFGTEALRFTSVHIARPLSTSSSVDRSIKRPAAELRGQTRRSCSARRRIHLRSRQSESRSAFRYRGNVSSRYPAVARIQSSGIAGDQLLRPWRRGQRSNSDRTQAGRSLVPGFGN